MTDSSGREALDAMHDRNREQRIEGIKRWVEYITSEPPEVWGPQQNAIVDGQLESAQRVSTSVAHQQRVTELAAEIIDNRDDSERGPE